MSSHDFPSDLSGVPVHETAVPPAAATAETCCSLTDAPVLIIEWSHMSEEF